MAMSTTMRREATDDRLLVAGTMACLVVGAALLHFFAPINHDEAFFMALAGRLLDGGQFGKDIMDMNPPHVWWISTLPVWSARQIGVRVDFAATVFTVAMAGLSLLAIQRLTAAIELFARRTFLIFAALLLLFAPGYDFGQREHWMLLLTLPYIVLCSCRLNNAAISPVFASLIGAAACLGFCIKPYLLVVPIATEVWLLVQKRQPSLAIRAETVGLATTGIAYAGLTWIYARSYLEIEVPTALLGYWSYKSPAQEVVTSAIILLAPSALLLSVGYLTRRRSGQAPATAQALAIAGGASLFAALIQMKPWSYHFLPSVVFFDLAALVLLVSDTPCRNKHALRRIALVILVATAIVPSTFEGLRALEGPSSPVNQFAAVFRSNPGPNKTVFGFITSPRDVFPAVVAADMKWAAPFCCEYLVAAAARMEEAPAGYQSKIKAAGLNQAKLAVLAIRSKEPGVVVIATGDDMLGFNRRSFDYVRWLSAHTDFASVFAHYHETGPIGSFRVFVRKP